MTALTIAAARFLGFPDLKLQEPTTTPTHPNFIIYEATEGVATPPAAKLTTGNFL